jgi:hypothetical protein
MQPLAEINDGRLYDLLEVIAAQARESAGRMVRLYEDPDPNPQALAEAAQAATKLAEALRKHLGSAVFTSLPKADLEALLRNLTAMPITALRFAQRSQLAPANAPVADFAPALGWIQELTELVLDAVRQLRGFENLERIKELYRRLERIAEHAEGSIRQAVNATYQRDARPLEIMAMTDLGDLLSAFLDHGRQAGSLMNRLSLQFL